MNKNLISLTLLGQYVKDLSFENPLAPNIPSVERNPKVNLDVNTEYLKLQNDTHEINLKIKVMQSLMTMICLLLSYSMQVYLKAF